MTAKRENKIPKSFRLSPRVAEVVRQAAEQAGLSAGDLIECCIINQANGVVSQYSALKREEAVSALLDALAKRKGGMSSLS